MSEPPPQHPEPDLPACVVNCVWYGPQGQRHAIGLDAISDVLAEHADGFVWLGLYEPEAEVLAKLQEEFGLHELAIEDAQMAHQRPKVESYGDSLFIATNTAQVVDEHIRYGETHAFLGPRYLITVRHGASLSYAPVRARLEREPEFIRLGPCYAAYAVLDAIVDNYLPIAASFRETLSALEQDIFNETYRRDIVVRLYDLKRELTFMRMAVAPMQDVLAQLVRSASPLIVDDIRPYLRDVFDHSVRVNEAIDVQRDMLGTALGVNQSLVTLAQGETVKRLGAWAALLAAPTLITSWYGMNFHHMPELDLPWAYPAMIVGVGVACAGLYGLFKRLRWL
ncbi:MAG TPA: magnesium transporter CorA [Xanthomonadaceae bacterium]|nr:magnesium transporter CorA [Xanthomonadaceae bacterium]